jgi:hypothetical protein
MTWRKGSQVGECDPGAGSGGPGVPPEQRAGVPGAGERRGLRDQQWGDHVRGLQLHRPGLPPIRPHPPPSPPPHPLTPMPPPLPSPRRPVGAGGGQAGDRPQPEAQWEDEGTIGRWQRGGLCGQPPCHMALLVPLPLVRVAEMPLPLPACQGWDLGGFWRGLLGGRDAPSSPCTGGGAQGGGLPWGHRCRWQQCHRAAGLPMRPGPQRLGAHIACPPPHPSVHPLVVLPQRRKKGGCDGGGTVNGVGREGAQGRQPIPRPSAVLPGGPPCPWQAGRRAQRPTCWGLPPA